MTSIWNENFSLFAKRFPELAKILEPQIPAALKGASKNQGESNARGREAANEKSEERDRADFLAFLNRTFPFCRFSLAKSGAVTASENSLALHSAYNPQAEAERAAKELNESGKDIFVFAGIGLGYLPAAAARLDGAEQKAFVILEPDAPHFFAALASLDLKALFAIPKLFFAVGADDAQAASLVRCAGGFDKAKICSQKAQAAHAQKWFDGFFARAKEDADKSQVNENTLERFGRLWLKNGARNARQMQALDGANIFFGEADFGGESGALPSVLLAAGPSLESVLPHLKEIKERAVTIAVDTAVRACLRAGVQPDFIVLTDPQFWASRHIAGLSCPESILIAESAVYPSVFRFDCKKIVLMSSLFPLGKFFEARFGTKGVLASGGSVATSAWDFARAIGSKEIYAAGLDLGYPNKQTHIKGSAFEEAAHHSSGRLNTAEQQTTRILFSAKNKKAAALDGSPVITDERMALFASWFERQIERDEKSKTFCFSKKGLFIKGIDFFPLEEFLEKPRVQKRKADFFSRALQKSSSYDKEKFDEALGALAADLRKIDSLSQKGIALCDEILRGDRNAQRRIGELDAIDKAILESEAKNVAALVFPTGRQLEQIFSRTQFPQDALKNAAARSKIVYAELSKSIAEFLKIR